MLLQSYRKEMFRPECNPGFESLHCFAHLEQDVGEVLPYLNAELGGFEYVEEPPSVTFRSQDGALRGAIGVEREDVRQWLDTQTSAWRDELADAGIKVERLDVNLLPRGGQDGHAAPWQDGGTGQWTDTPGHREAASEAPLPALPDTLPELGVNRALTTGRLDCWA